MIKLTNALQAILWILILQIPTNINSQACEQLNSALCKLHTSISGMPSHNAKRHLSVFLAIRNLDKNADYESANCNN